VSQSCNVHFVLFRIVSPGVRNPHKAYFWANVILRDTFRLAWSPDCMMYCAFALTI